MGTGYSRYSLNFERDKITIGLVRDECENRNEEKGWVDAGLTEVLRGALTKRR
jgi:hypothetical protein